MLPNTGWFTDPAPASGDALVSYSQNAEDIRLWRVFRDVESGFYVDVGAGGPMEGSVTQLFYEHGWSGVNIEPSPVFEALRNARPRDVNLCAAVGQGNGEVAFFVTYPDIGMSTLDLTAHAHVPDAVERYDEITVPQHRLETILHDHAAGRTIHFLKVDVEGAERDVLVSSDWSTFRPMVVVVEAVRSWSTTPAHEQWESILTHAGYEPAAFDGINRFYVDSEHRDLVARLAYPISPLDGFVPAALYRSQSDAKAFRDEAESLQAELRHTNHEVELLHAEVRELRRDNQDLEPLRAEVDELRTRNEELRRRAEELQEALAAVYQSPTWRIGRLAARAGKPAVAVVRRVRTRAERLTPRQAYRQATAAGQPWHFPRRGAAAKRSTVSPLDGLIRALGRPERPIRPADAPTLRAAIQQTGWAEEDSLLAKRLSWDERQAVLEADALVELIAASTTNHDEFRRRATRTGDTPLVVVDARCLQDPAYRSRGVGHHAQAVLRAVIATTKELRPVLLTSAELPELSTAVTELAEDIVVTPSAISLSDVALFVQLSPMTASIGPATPFLASARCRSAAIVYDFIPSEYPAAYLETAASMLANRVRIEALRRYDLILPISSATAEACRRVVGEGSDVVVSGVGDSLHGIDRVAHGDAAPYVLVPAGGDARKNCAVAVTALAAHLGLGSRPLRLVATGSLTGPQASALQSLANQMGLDADALEVRRDVPQQELSGLYEDAELVFVGSFAEGFSIPVAEAILRGTPVVASDIPAHRELLGSGPWLSAPRDVDAFASAMAYVLEHRDRVVEQQRQSLGDAADPGSVADRVLNALEGLLPPGSLGHTRLSPPAARPHLAVLSPYPPQRSGVADYTAFTFRHMERYADVTIFSNAVGHEPSELVHPLSAAPFLDPQFDAVVSVVGNSHFHFPILDLLGTYGGVCVAHDDRMIEAYGFDRGDEWVSKIVSGDGRVVTPPELTDMLLDLDRLPSIGYDVIARQATPLIVHGKALARRIEGETGIAPAVVPFVPYNRPALDTIDGPVRSHARKALGLPPDALHIGTFGIVDRRTKGADLVVGALAWLRSWGVNARLHVVGGAPPMEQRAVETIGEELEVGGYVTFHGHVSREDLEHFLLAVDVGVQIRTSALLSLSGSVADCLAYGVPSVTTEDLALELDAPSYVATTPAATSSLLLAEAIESLRNRRNEEVGSIDAERRAYLEKRSPDSYARGLLEALGLSP